MGVKSGDPGALIRRRVRYYYLLGVLVAGMFAGELTMHFTEGT